MKKLRIEEMMNLFSAKIKAILFAVLLLSLTACGGGGGGGDSEPPGAVEDQSIDSGSFTQNYLGNSLIDLEGSSGVYYEVASCNASLTATGSVFADGTIFTYDTFNGQEINSTCFVTRTFEKQDLTNQAINAVWISRNFYYDNSTKVYYEIDGGNDGSSNSIVEVLNDGMSVKLNTGQTYPVVRAFVEVAPEAVGISLYQPNNAFFTSSSDELMEIGYTIGISGKPYNMYDSYLYRYEQSGCTLGYMYYFIYNNGVMDTINYDGSEGSCVISKYFEHIDVVDQNLTANYVDTGDTGAVFYDQNTSIYYDVDYIHTYAGDVELTQILNDGNSGMLRFTSGNSVGNTFLVRVYGAYKEVTP
jgi:hypothetical protein